MLQLEYPEALHELSGFHTDRDRFYLQIFWREKRTVRHFNTQGIEHVLQPHRSVEAMKSTPIRAGSFIGHMVDITRPE
jgi:hypothetical protein